MGGGAPSKPRPDEARTVEEQRSSLEETEYETHMSTSALRDGEPDDDADTMTEAEHEQRLAAQRERNRLRASNPAKFADARRPRQSHLNASRKAEEELDATLPG